MSLIDRLMKRSPDFLEREEQEQTIAPGLNLLNAEVLDILARVRSKAKAAIAALPEPASSTRGADYWKSSVSEKCENNFQFYSRMR